MKRVLSLFLFVGALSNLNAQQNVDFQSAEERIVYNKVNNLNKYEGVAVEYTYQVLDGVKPDESEIHELANSYFTEILDIDVYTIDGAVYISFLTEGKHSNHEGSFQLRDELFKKFEFSKRNYHLK